MPRTLCQAGNRTARPCPLGTLYPLACPNRRWRTSHRFCAIRAARPDAKLTGLWEHGDVRFEFAELGAALVGGHPIGGRTTRNWRPSSRLIASPEPSSPTPIRTATAGWHARCPCGAGAGGGPERTRAAAGPRILHERCQGRACPPPAQRNGRLATVQRGLRARDRRCKLPCRARANDGRLRRPAAVRLRLGRRNRLRLPLLSSSQSRNGRW